MKIYISGIREQDILSQETCLRYAKAEKMLIDKGYEVFNPANSGFMRHAESLVDAAEYHTSLTQELLLLNLSMLAQCDAIYITGKNLPVKDYKVEFCFASATGKQFFYDDKTLALLIGREDQWLPIEE